MADLQLRARSATELVDASFALYRRQPLPYIMLAAFAYAPWLIVQLLFLGARPTTALDPRYIVISLVIALGNLITYSVMSAALVRYVSREYLGEPADVASALQDILPRVPAVIGAALLKAVVLIVGAMLFLVGLLYFAARFFAVNQAIILEDRGVGASFSRSGVLSRGLKWHILGTLLLVFVIYFLLSMAVSVVGALSRSPVVMTVLTTAYVVIAYPLFAIVETLLYYDTRIRAEGFDIEVLTNALGAPMPAGEMAP